MKLKIKKFIYLLNDITNIALKKDRLDLEEKNKKLRITLIIVSMMVVLLVIIIFYLIKAKYAH